MPRLASSEHASLSVCVCGSVIAECRCHGFGMSSRGEICYRVLRKAGNAVAVYAALPGQNSSTWVCRRDTLPRSAYSRRVRPQRRPPCVAPARSCADADGLGHSSIHRSRDHRSACQVACAVLYRRSQMLAAMTRTRTAIAMSNETSSGVMPGMAGRYSVYVDDLFQLTLNLGLPIRRTEGRPI